MWGGSKVAGGGDARERTEDMPQSLPDTPVRVCVCLSVSCSLPKSTC